MIEMKTSIDTIKVQWNASPVLHVNDRMSELEAKVEEL